MIAIGCAAGLSLLWNAGLTFMLFTKRGRALYSQIRNRQNGKG